MSYDDIVLKPCLFAWGLTLIVEAPLEKDKRSIYTNRLLKHFEKKFYNEFEFL